MTHNTSTRLRTAGLNVVASVADTVAAAARRANIDLNRRRVHDQEPDERLHQREQRVRRREALLTAVIDQLIALTRGEQPPLWPEATDDDTEGADTEDDVVDEAAATVQRLVTELQDREAGIVGAFVSLAQRWQTTAHGMQQLAADVLRRHPDDAEMLEDSYRISHAAATQARAAQSLTVLAGRWPGQQWSALLPLAEVVRAASGRIADYRRVEVTGGPGVAVVSALAEPLIHLIAEFLANATQSSPASTQVVVTFDEVDAGWAITVADDGLGLDGERLQWAQDRVSGRDRVGLHELGEPPQTGLAVVGTFARQYGFLVHLDGTANGGVRAVTVVPHNLLQTVANQAAVVATPAPRRPTHAAAPAPATSAGAADELASASQTAGQTPNGLPIRRRRAPMPATPSLPSAPPPVPDPETEGEWMTNFMEGSRVAPAPATPSDGSPMTDSEETP